LRLPDGRVSCAGNALVLLADVDNLVLVRAQHFFEPRRIRRAVVHDDGFEIAKGLGENGVQTIRNQRSRVVARDDDADSRYPPDIRFQSLLSVRHCETPIPFLHAGRD
jgi:hypothetical protein